MSFGKHYGTCPYCGKKNVWLPLITAERSIHYRGRCEPRIIEVRRVLLAVLADRLLALALDAYEAEIPEPTDAQVARWNLQ